VGNVTKAGGAGEKAGSRSVIYCMIPGDLAVELHDVLREHWRDDPSTVVVVERREETRRIGKERRTAVAAPPAERRQTRSASGRRIADRREPAMMVDSLSLPRVARRHADRLVFLERIEAIGKRAHDIETDRLVVRCQAGDKDAMSQLYLRHFDAVYRYARMMMRDAHEAEDVSQQVFMRVLGKISTYERRPGVPFRAWLVRVARSVIIDTLRRTPQPSPQDPVEIAELTEAPVSGEHVASALRVVSDSDLAVLIRRLPSGQRDVIALRFLLDLSTEEIATVTGRTNQAVRQLQSRALRALEEWLTALGRTPVRRQRAPMLSRVRPAPVLASRRFALSLNGRAPSARIH
jgi:RNA polymerase sigma-70 factor (ECF subfamily)